MEGYAPRMPLTGKLRSWNDDRGYGFIAPTHGGRELFVHISAFPSDGSRPTVGETLTYELGKGDDGKPQAVRVYRQALGRPSDYPRSLPGRTARKPSRVFPVVGIVLLAAVAAYGYRAYQERVRASLPSPIDVEGAPAPAPAPREGEQAFRCDGRIHCSQMSSCAEATFFLKNCPGTEMDGDRDGVPCEQQWCPGP